MSESRRACSVPGLRVRPWVAPAKPSMERRIRCLRQEGMGMLAIAKEVGCGTSGVQPVVGEMD